MIIYSPNNFDLLNKLRKDLIEVGYIDDQEWNYRKASAADIYLGTISYLHVDGNVLVLYSIEPDEENKCITTLTESNYTDILNQLKDAL